MKENLELWHKVEKTNPKYLVEQSGDKVKYTHFLQTGAVALEGEADHEAQEHKVQFELNGQSRMVHVPMRHADGEGKTRGTHKRAKADPANALHVAAPMAGGVVSVAVKPGQKVKAGDALLALEAMKMETHLNAERDAEIEQVLVHAGDQIDAKDLLVVFKP